MTLPAPTNAIHALAAAAMLAVPTLPAAAQTAATAAVASDDRAATRRKLQEQLTRAMARIAANRNDVDALVAAGQAALALDDRRGALGFFTRAVQLDAGHGAAAAGLASVRLRQQDVAAAMAGFRSAEAARADPRLYLADRGLVHDLRGEPRAAQADYERALGLATTAPPLAVPMNSDDIIRRLAMSLGISGEADRAIALLTPQLRAQNRAAWRVRALVLAMNNRTGEAREIVKATLPPQLATSLEPFLPRLAALTPAEQARAVYFGALPPTASPAAPPPGQIAAAPPVPPAPTPASVVRPAARAALPAPVPSPTPAPAPAPAVAIATSAPTVLSTAPLASAARPAAAPPAPTPPAASLPAAPAPVPVAAPAPAPRQGPELLAASEPRPAAVPPLLPIAPTPAPTPPPPPAPAFSLGDIVASLDTAADEARRDVAALDAAALAAVQRDAAAAAEAERRAEAARRAKAAADTRAKAEADRASAEAAAKAKAEADRRAANPARTWVQIATGADPAALAFDWRRLARQAPALFTGRSGATAAWGRTRRLVAGPFANAAAANKWLTDYKAAGGDGFVWRSGAGEVAEPLP